MSLTLPHPAGRDVDLRVALEDLRLNRWLSTKELLARTESWSLRCSRSQVLGRSAVGTEAIEMWAAEEPEDWNAWMMRARVLSERVVLAHRNGASRPQLMQAILKARYACSAAAEWKADPVPPLCFMTLAQADDDPRRPHSPLNWIAREDLLPPGPWRLLDAVHQRDAHNREAFHRMLAVFRTRGNELITFAQWVASRAPVGSPLKVLPLYAFVDQYRKQWATRQTASVLAYWVTEDKAHYARQALYEWFEPTQPVPGQPDTRSLLDLNHLAHALTATGVGHAGPVFEAIGPHVTTAPWAQVAHEPQEWQEEFLKARRPSLRSGDRR